jgi:hypothetical protein
MPIPPSRCSWNSGKLPAIGTEPGIGADLTQKLGVTRDVPDTLPIPPVYLESVKAKYP